ncbi:MAG: helix-turn-helix domain-containing protein [Actinomycetota bacterium]|nr:helix-turn-helix domain-containing protein [Actinomycetota bacterium]
MGTRPSHVDPGDGALLRAKALSASRRVEIVSLLRGADAPVTAAALAAALGIHHTAVRQHLALLVEAGLVAPHAMPVEGRGRPRTGYLVVEPGAPYRELAGMLADAVRAGRSAREAGREAGLRVEPSVDGPLVTLRDEAARLGFDPELHDPELHDSELHDVVLRSCPFADLAAEQPDMVCDLHVGLAEGIAERAGGMVVLGISLADPHRGGCRIRTQNIAR